MRSLISQHVNLSMVQNFEFLFVISAMESSCCGSRQAGDRSCCCARVGSAKWNALVPGWHQHTGVLLVHPGSIGLGTCKHFDVTTAPTQVHAAQLATISSGSVDHAAAEPVHCKAQSEKAWVQVIWQKCRASMGQAMVTQHYMR